MTFHQQGPALENTWTSDPFLQSALRRLLPPDVFAAIAPGLERLGRRAAFEMPAYAADAENHPPQHVPYDPWGRRIDDIRLADGWKRLHEVAAEEGIVAVAYEREHGAHSRVHQFARLYLYHPSSALCSCPFAMTDGAARLIELHGTDALRRHALPRLVTRDPRHQWTSGQWMTERAGGSDVSRTETVARRNGNDYRLYGTKWFTSATTSDMAFTLARLEDRDVSAPLGLFYVELRGDDGRLRNIRVHRLKDKLGTRALPTAELTLEGARGVLVGEAGKGVRVIATLLNITRLYNACSAASQMRRGLQLANDYAGKRVAFGRPLAEHPLHRETLDALEAETRGATLMVLHAAALLGKDETGTASESERRLLRMLTPLVKLYTAKQAIAVCSETLECFGGAGYIEDTGLPALLRDAQVLSIWEGTTNVLALDLLRAMDRADCLSAWIDDIRRRIANLEHPDLDGARHFAIAQLEVLGNRPQPTEQQARRFAYALARIHGAVLLAEQAQWELAEGNDASLRALQHWLRGDVLPRSDVGV